MSYKKQYYGIKFPFTSNNEDGLFVDLNNDLKDKVGSEIAHVILTPKKSRIRMPDFGTDLIKYLFNPNDESSWDDVKEEIKKSVSTFVPNAIIDDVNVVSDNNDNNSIYVDIKYSIKRGVTNENNRMVIKL